MRKCHRLESLKADTEAELRVQDVIRAQNCEGKERK